MGANPQRELDDEELEASSLPSKRFRWVDRPACVEALVSEMADNGGRYAEALRVTRVRNYCLNISKMPLKQQAALKRDVMNRFKDLLHIRESADVGDIVKVQMQSPAILPGSLQRVSRKLVEAEVIERVRIAQSFRFRVRRLEDGGIQTGNGHMIKGIVQKHMQGGEQHGDEPSTTTS